MNELTFAHFEKEEIEEAIVSSDAVTVVLMKSGTKVTEAHCSSLIYDETATFEERLKVLECSVYSMIN